MSERGGKKKEKEKPLTAEAKRKDEAELAKRAQKTKIQFEILRRKIQIEDTDTTQIHQQFELQIHGNQFCPLMWVGQGGQGARGESKPNQTLMQ